jgi:hypothetical protein
LNRGWPLPSKGPTTHTEDCACVRCLGFTPGPNGSAVAVQIEHGAHSRVQIEPRANELADSLRESLIAEGIYRPLFEPTLAACALILVRIERLAGALALAEEEGGPPTNDRDPDRLRQWTNTARGYLSDLGMTPTSLARIARDTGLASVTRTEVAFRELERHLAAEHAEIEK